MWPQIPLVRTSEEKMCSGTIMEELWGRACSNQRPESWNIFFVGYPYHSEKNKCGQLICALERTTANAPCSSFPPTGRPKSLSIWRFDVGWKIRTPHNKQRGLEQRDWNREREARKGRTIDRWTVLWLKMATVFTADYEGLYSIHRKAVGVACDSAQQNQEPHSQVIHKARCLLWRWKLCLPVSTYCLSLCCVVCPVVFHVSAMVLLLCPPSHQKQSTSFDLTAECESHGQTVEDLRRSNALIILNIF